ncbi:MAG: preprotein translocase subunit SecE [Francisellaceae bacterium]|jgi:preprotein translocase subunit SecE|nr:preprotein translocase subunit SecE [Francisellaceae bacterium]MBT6539588.1 preprotein translocase subunit SecE [Francisellaceae bacterium]
MVSNVNEQKVRTTDVIWTFLILLLVSGCIFGFYYFSSDPLLYRVIALLASAGISVWLSLRTTWGQNAKAFLDSSIIELRKVIWPTRKETVQSTIAVVVMVFVMGLLLWGLDAIIFRVIAKIVGQGGV